MGIVLEKTREPEYPSPPRDNERKAVGWFLGGERRGEERRGGEGRGGEGRGGERRGGERRGGEGRGEEGRGWLYKNQGIDLTLA